MLSKCTQGEKSLWVCATLDYFTMMKNLFPHLYFHISSVSREPVEIERRKIFIMMLIRHSRRKKRVRRKIYDEGLNDGTSKTHLIFLLHAMKSFQNIYNRKIV